MHDNAIFFLLKKMKLHTQHEHVYDMELQQCGCYVFSERSRFSMSYRQNDWIEVDDLDKWLEGEFEMDELEKGVLYQSDGSVRH